VATVVQLSLVIAVGALGTQVNVGLNKSDFKFSAFCVAVDTGFNKSVVLSTFHSQTLVLSCVCHVLSHLKYCAADHAVIDGSFQFITVVTDVIHDDDN
jgi:hypothetical protein